MKPDRTGIILFVEKYKDCVSFYRDIFGLSILFQIEDLVCFEYGGSYLMIEPKDKNSIPEDGFENKENLCLRFNVTDFNAHCELLTSFGIKLKIEHHNWGSIARFKDPDGNNCALKDSEKFEMQIKDYQKRFE